MQRRNTIALCLISAGIILIYVNISKDNLFGISYMAVGRLELDCFGYLCLL